MTPPHQLALRASDAAAAFTAAMGPRGPQATARAKEPGEVEKEARARVVSEGGDPGNPMLVLGCHSIQLGKYQGQTFRWLLENDAGYACHVVASHQWEWETSASDSPLMANKDSLARYSCAHPAFAEHLKFRRVQEDARARATLSGRGGEALVGFGLFKEDTLKDLYDSKDKERQTYVKWLRRKTPHPGSAMDVTIQYILGRDKERLAVAAATPPLPASSSKAAASTVLPPRKPTAPNFSALVRGRPMGPGELQAQIRKLMTPPARPAVPAVSSVRDQRPSVPPPPTTEVTDEELVRMVTDVEMAGVQVLQALPLPLVTPPSPPPPAPSSTPPPPPPPPQVAAAPPTVRRRARASAQTRVEPCGVSVEEKPCGVATLASEPKKKSRKTTTGDAEQSATPTPAWAETRLPEGWRTALTGEEQEWIGRALFQQTSGGSLKLTTDLKLWWDPPQPRLNNSQPPASAATFFACRLFLWAPLHMWGPRPTCCQKHLTKCGMYKTIRKDVKARVTSVFGSILKMDSTKKVTRKLACAAAHTAAWATNVGNEHGQVSHVQPYKPFLQQLSASIFLWDPEDTARLLNAKRRTLEAQGMTFSSDAGVWRHVSRREMALHCRRCTRGAAATERLIDDLLQTFGGANGRDTMGIPLLVRDRIQAIRAEQRRHLECIQDPPGVELYTETGRLTKGGISLPTYRCARGSTSLESFHLHLNPFIPGESANPWHFQAFLLEGLTRWNEDRAASAAQEGRPLLRTYSGPLQHSLDQLSQRVLGSSLVREYTGELIGIEYLYSQTGRVLQAVSLDPDVPDAGPPPIEEDDELAEGRHELEDLTLHVPGEFTAPRTDPGSGQPADAPAPEPSRPTDPPEPAPRSPGRSSPEPQQAAEEYRGPDDQPGYLAVVRLATALVGLRHEQALSEGRVGELIGLYEALSPFDRARVVYPPRYTDGAARGGRFMAAKPARTSIPGVESLRRCLVGQTSGPASSPSASRLVEAVCVQLCNLYPTGTRVHGVVHRRLLAPRPPAPSAAYPAFLPTAAAAAAATGPLRATQPLLVDLSLPRQSVWVLPVPRPLLTLPQTLPAPRVLPPLLAAAQHAGPELPVPLKNVYRRKLNAKRRAEAQPGTIISPRAGVPQVQKCSKCGQPRRRETGHSRYGREYFCSVAAGQSVEDWLREKKEGDPGRAQD
ncbi:unnamed protein product [Boreogadus saida]